MAADEILFARVAGPSDRLPDWHGVASGGSNAELAAASVEEKGNPHNQLRSACLNGVR